MQTYISKILGYEAPVEVPADNDEYNRLDPSHPNPVLRDAIKFQILHVWNSEAREVIAETIERITNIPRKMKPGATKVDGTPGAEVPAETPQNYQTRALGEANVELASTVEEVLKALAPIKFDPSPGERAGGAGRINKEYFLIADGILEKGPEAVSKAVRRLKKQNPGLEIRTLEDGTVNRDSFALAIKTNAVRRAKEEEQALLAA